MEEGKNICIFTLVPVLHATILIFAAHQNGFFYSKLGIKKGSFFSKRSALTRFE